MDGQRPQPVHVSEAIRLQHASYFADHCADGRFFNPWSNFGKPGLRDVLKWQFEPNPHRREKRVSPEFSLVSDRRDEAISGDASSVTWLGHASFRIRTNANCVLLDPVLGHMGGGMIRRKVPSPLEVSGLAPVDVVCISHGHYDHLDKPSIRRIVAANPEVILCVPLGMAAILPRTCRNVVEFDWWTELSHKGVTYSFVPAQHWHRRGLFDLNRVLWGGWVVTGSHRFYHSGDTGFFPGFEAIGGAFPGIDVAMLPLGAYEPAWFMGPQHMRPSDSVKAFGLLQAGHFLGMHWGTFDLSDEPLDGGVVEARSAWEQRGYARDRLHTLQPGGSLSLTKAGVSTPDVYVPAS